jgi:hypothetical protein
LEPSGVYYGRRFIILTASVHATPSGSRVIGHFRRASFQDAALTIFLWILGFGVLSMPYQLRRPDIPWPVALIGTIVFALAACVLGAVIVATFSVVGPRGQKAQDAIERLLVEAAEAERPVSSA